MLKDKLVNDVLKMVMWIALAIVASRITMGLSMWVIASLAFYWGINKKNWLALSCFFMFCLFNVMNSMIFPKAVYSIMALRLGMVSMAIALFLGSTKRRGTQKLPLERLTIFIIVAMFSSFGGYMPAISYMKILNYVLFIVAIWAGTSNIHTNYEELYKLRCVILAICTLVIGGSYLTLPFPDIAYPQNIRSLMIYHGLSREEAALLIGASSEMSYLAGILVHSNTLAPILCGCFTFLICDMLFVERKIVKFHIVLLVLTMPLMIYTRARGGMITLLAAVIVVFFFGTSMIQIDGYVRHMARKVILSIICLAVVGVTILEIRDNGFTKFIRKTNNTQMDNRTLSEALSESRRNLIEVNMKDFWRNPVLGMGFQTWELHSILYKTGKISLLSAPVEKGVLPLMILGETGVIGAIAFLFWFISFLTICRRKNYVCTICGMTVLLTSNLGEACFFSPSGVGGLLWVMTVVGGFICDMQITHHESVEKQIIMMNHNLSNYDCLLIR